MDSGILLVVVTVLTSGCVADDMYRCPDNLFRTNNLKTFRQSCYQFYPYETFWGNAQSECRRKSGHLVVIKDHETQDFIMTSLRELNWQYKGVWIGASDRDKEMHWKWVTGETITWNNFASGQPSCRYFCVEDCAQIRLDRGGDWHDYPCSGAFYHYSFICQYEMKPPTTTTSTTTTTTTAKLTTILPNSTTVTTSSPPEIKIVNKSLLGSKKNHSSRYHHHSDTTTTSTPTTTTTTSVVEHIQVIQQGMHGSESVEQTSGGGLDTGTAIGLILGILFGLFIGICLGAFVFFRRRHKHVDEDFDKVVFENQYYGEAAAPLAVKDFTSDEEDITPTDIPPSMCLTNPTYGTNMRVHGNDATYDHPPRPSEILPECEPYDQPPPPPCRNKMMYDSPKSLDDTFVKNVESCEENLYESLENLQNLKAALIMKDNAFENSQEERYVPMGAVSKEV